MFGYVQVQVWIHIFLGTHYENLRGFLYIRILLSCKLMSDDVQGARG